MPKADILILGGGPGGLSAALAASRAARTSVVFDTHSYRNAMVHEFHTFPGRDHTSPRKFREDAREELSARYASFVSFVERGVVQAWKGSESGEDDAGGFGVKDEQGQVWEGRKLIFAVGSRDVFPDIEGFAACWGPGGIYPCFFCDGLEDSGAPHAGILCLDASQPGSLEGSSMFAMMASRFVPKITLYTNGSLTSELKKDDRVVRLEKKGFKFDDRKILRLEPDSRSSEEREKTRTFRELKIHFETAEPATVAFLGYKGQTELPAIAKKVATGLGLTFTPNGEIEVQGPMQGTSVPGVFAAGDCQTMLKQVHVAVSSGAVAAAMAAHSMMMEDLEA
ncbi:FAD/NAD(P)-binding domain-containing protein [Meredithblackwellia eburnea MCA 4105]